MLNIYNPNQQSQNQDAVPMPKPKPAIKPANFRRYVDTTGDFDNKELEYSIWWVKHKVLLYRILLIILIVINVGLYSVNIGMWGSYLVGIASANRVESASSRFANYSGIKAHFNPEPIQILSSHVLQSGVDKYDAVAEVVNPNTKFIVDIEYRFVFDATSTELVKTKLLAGQTNLLAAMGVSKDIAGSGNAILQIEKENWTRIDNHKVQDAIAWQNERLNFVVSDPLFQSAYGADGLSSNRVAFTLKNASPFSFKTPIFIIGLYSGETLVGTMITQTDHFRSGEERFIDLRNFAPGLQVSDLKLYPQIDLYDNQNYIAPGK